MQLTESRLGAYLRSAREARDLTQDELAAQVHTTRSTIAAIETGHVKQPSVDLINGLAAALHVPVRDVARAMGLNVEIGDEAEIAAQHRLIEDLIQQLDRLRRRLPPMADSG